LALVVPPLRHAPAQRLLHFGVRSDRLANGFVLLIGDAQLRGKRQESSAQPRLALLFRELGNIPPVAHERQDRLAVLVQRDTRRKRNDIMRQQIDIIPKDSAIGYIPELREGEHAAPPMK